MTILVQCPRTAIRTDSRRVSPRRSSKIGIVESTFLEFHVFPDVEERRDKEHNISLTEEQEVWITFQQYPKPSSRPSSTPKVSLPRCRMSPTLTMQVLFRASFPYQDTRNSSTNPSPLLHLYYARIALQLSARPPCWPHSWHSSTFHGSCLASHGWLVVGPGARGIRAARGDGRRAIVLRCYDLLWHL